jgi:UDP-N-acetylmuramate--alanine ligase
MEHIHFIGIGGTGLSAIAKVLLEQGFKVSGSDLQDSPLFESVKTAGGEVALGHRSENIQGANLVIRSSAVPEDNPEITAAKKAGIPVLKRSEFLKQLTADKQVLAVAGSHGKTTTSSMLTWILTSLDLDPSFIIGGVVADLKTNARAGTGDYFVIEADEYDYMFLGLHPQLAVVTNVEHDHPDIFPTPEVFQDAFRQFVGHLRPEGVLITCAESPAAVRLGKELSADQKQIHYGFDTSPAEYRAVNIQVNRQGGMDFEIALLDNELLPVSLKIPGRHNVLNALAAFAAADSLGVDREAVCQALGKFSGSGRRFEIRGEWAGIMVVDDYGHHPTEIKATLAAAREAFPARYIRAVWQPHTYSRTTTLADDFRESFRDADQVIVLDVYEAREKQPGDFQIEDLVSTINHDQALFIAENDRTAAYLKEKLQPGDLLLVFSAGDAVEINDQIERYLLADRG